MTRGIAKDRKIESPLRFQQLHSELSQTKHSQEVAGSFCMGNLGYLHMGETVERSCCICL